MCRRPPPGPAGAGRANHARVTRHGAPDRFGKRHSCRTYTAANKDVSVAGFPDGAHEIADFLVFANENPPSHSRTAADPDLDPRSCIGGSGLSGNH